MRVVVKAHLPSVSGFHCLLTVLPPDGPESVGVVYGHPGGRAGQAEHGAPGSGPPVTGSLKVVVKSWRTEGTESVSSVRFVPFETELIPGSVLGLDVR